MYIIYFNNVSSKKKEKIDNGLKAIVHALNFWQRLLNYNYGTEG